jgi:hypothetical protein
VLPLRSALVGVMFVGSSVVAVATAASEGLLGLKIKPAAFNTKIPIAMLNATTLVTKSTFLFICFGILFVYFLMLMYILTLKIIVTTDSIGKIVKK